MQRDRYMPVSDSARETYEFLSSGPRGTVKKVVQYIEIKKNIYNLGFGDWDDQAQSVKDDIRTNNKDRAKVLATVAFTVFDFMMHHPGAILFAQGSTPARTRLYQMGISGNLVEIEQLFQIEGYYKGSWEAFKTGRNYQAFSLKAK